MKVFSLLVTIFVLTLATLPSYANAYIFTRDLTVGSTGPDVVELQKLLEGYGYLVLPPGIARGSFGPATKSALMIYQKVSRITPTNGYFGSSTRITISSPKITSLSANYGAYGRKVIINGQGLTPDTVVYFDNRPLTSVYASTTAISITIPLVKVYGSKYLYIKNSIGISSVVKFKVISKSGGSSSSDRSNSSTEGGGGTDGSGGGTRGSGGGGSGGSSYNFNNRSGQYASIITSIISDYLSLLRLNPTK